MIPERARLPLLVGSLLAALAVLFALSLFAGPTASLLHDLDTHHGAARRLVWLVLLQIRLPRALLGILVGASLGLSGAVLQGFLRNPLAEPALVGASSSAALGAVAMIYSGLAASFSWAIPLGGLVGAMAGMALVGVLAGPGTSVLTLILAGVAVNSLAGALTALALNLASSPYASLEIVYWMLGSLADRGFDQIRLVLPFMLAGWALLLPLSRTLDALSLGDEAAASLGFDLRRARLMVIAGVGLAVGASVAVSGVVGFVGLVVPHVLRPAVAHRPGALPAISALGGAVLTLAADLVAAHLLPGHELNLGVVTALVGAPFFLHLLLRLRGQLQ